MITPQEADVIADAIVRKQTDAWLLRSPICSREEAMSYARIRSKAAWYRFCARNGLTSLNDGNYSRHAVERATRHEEKTAA